MEIDIKKYLENQREINKTNCEKKDKLKDEIDGLGFLKLFIGIVPTVSIALLGIILGAFSGNPLLILAIMLPLSGATYFGSTAITNKIEKKEMFERREELRQVEIEINKFERLNSSVKKLEALIEEGLTQEKFNILSDTYKKVNNKESEEVSMEEFISYIYPEDIGASNTKIVSCDGLFCEEKLELPRHYLRMEKLYQQSDKKL